MTPSIEHLSFGWFVTHPHVLRSTTPFCFVIKRSLESEHVEKVGEGVGAEVIRTLGYAVIARTSIFALSVVTSVTVTLVNSVKPDDSASARTVSVNLPNVIDSIIPDWTDSAALKLSDCSSSVQASDDEQSTSLVNSY